MFKRKTPSKKQVKELTEKGKGMAKTEQKKDSQEKEAQEKKKREQKKAPDKVDLILTTLKRYVQKVDRMENILSAKDSQDQKTQTKLSSAEELAKIEAEQDKERAQRKQGQPGQQPGQGQAFYETPEYQKLSKEERLKAWEEGARQQQAQLQAQQGQGQQPGDPDNFERLMRIINGVGPLVVQGLKEDKKDSGSLGSFFQNLKVYSSVENSIMGNAFRWVKLLSPNQQQAGARNLMEQAANLPGLPEILRERGHVE